MVAPILGLIAAAAAKPHYENYASSVKANAVNRRAERAGVDLNTASPDELNRFGMQNGLIDFAQGQGNAQQAQQFGMQHDLSLQQHDLSERRFGLQEAQFDHARFLDGLNAAQGMLPDYSGTDANGVLDVTALTNAHVNMESGDNYQALGPVISNPNSSVYGEQALGRYQVMPSTMRRWTKELFGKEMTEDEFLNSPTAQDFVYRKKFLEVAQNEGVANALSKWHSGKSFAEAAAAGVADQNMSTVNYVNSVMSEMERQSAALEEQRLKGWLAENNSEGLRTLENPYAPQPAKDAVRADAIAEMQRRSAAAYVPQNEILEGQAQTYGAGWMGLDAEARRGVLSLERSITDVAEVIDFFDESTALGREMDKGERERMSGKWNMTVLPFLQKMTDAGAMQEAELELFKEWAGNPNSWRNLSNANKGKMMSILGQMRGYYGDMMASMGLNARSLDPLEGLTPVFGGDNPDFADTSGNVPSSGISPNFSN